MMGVQSVEKATDHPMLCADGQQCLRRHRCLRWMLRDRGGRVEFMTDYARCSGQKFIFLLDATEDLWGFLKNDG